jgi:hypothetical protein
MRPDCVRIFGTWRGGPSSDVPVAAVAAKYRVGEWARCKHRGTGERLSGKIVSVSAREGDTVLYTLQYSDGDRDMGMKEVDLTATEVRHALKARALIGPMPRARRVMPCPLRVLHVPLFGSPAPTMLLSLSLP